jgi:CheY-like chemotaxis protein
LNFNVVEIRLLDSKTGKLEPLLSEGLLPEATNRVLYAQPQNNGVTGFVAATGKSYLCEDTTEDPLYLEGAAGAKSSLTVPLVLHDEVIGTFNVESPEPRAFSESDLQFLEIFTRDVALALNTLELLVAEKASTAAESVEAIHSAVALPVDDILNDAVNIMERYIGHEPEVAERLQRILRNARDIKQVIQQVGQQMAPSQAHPQAMQVSERPHIRGLTVLVADADESVRSAAHSLLERYGCIVETAHDGGEAIFMVRNLSPGQSYDVIIADIRLPDMSGYEFMVKLQSVLEHVPLVLMTGFGYDPGHSIVKARQAGLPAGAVLYKPFRLDQLLETVEQVVRSRAVEQAWRAEGVSVPVGLISAGGRAYRAILGTIPGECNTGRLMPSARLSLLNLHADAPGAQRLVHAGEPQLFPPDEPEAVAHFAQLAAVVGAATPEAARHSAAERVFAGQQQHPCAGHHHPRQLGQAEPGVGQVLDHVAARDAVERAVGERQARHVGHQMVGQAALQAVATSPDHRERKIEAGEPRPEIGVLQQMFGDLAGPAPHVQDLPCTA